MILSDGDKPERYLGAFVSADAFTILGVQPILGRNFRADEDQANTEPVVLLAYNVWKSHFASDPGVVGRVVTVNGKRATIIGVMPNGWRFPETSDLWMPLKTTEKEDPRGNFNFNCFARMKPGVTIDQARAELEASAARIAADHPQSNAGCSAYVRDFREETVANAKTLTLLLMGAVLFLQLIACANVANLLLARAASRDREIAVRIALGAGRGAIIRQLFAESLVLGVDRQRGRTNIRVLGRRSDDGGNPRRAAVLAALRFRLARLQFHGRPGTRVGGFVWIVPGVAGVASATG